MKGINNINLLKSKMALFGDNQRGLAQKLGISETTLSKKINEYGNSSFTKIEMEKVKEIYNLTDSEMISIFFN